MQLRRNQVVSVATSQMVPGGVAFGRYEDGRPVFVRGGAPNELADVRLTKIKRDFLEGEFVRAIQISPDRVVAPFSPEALAGANWHYLAYPAQLIAKQAMVRELLSRSLSEDDAPMDDIVGADALWRYRNKIELTFALDENDNIRLGFHAPGRFDAIIPTDDVSLFPEVIREIIARVQRWANIEKLTVFDPRAKTGFLRNLVVRRAAHGSDLLLHLVTSSGELAEAPLLAHLQGLTFSGLIWSQNTSPATIVRSDVTKVLSGSDYLREEFLGQPLHYRFDSFFQTNTVMAEQLARAVLQRLEASNPSEVIDAYAGVGGFGLFAAMAGAQVTSIESHEPSLLDGIRNAERLGVEGSVTFVHAPMEEYIATVRLGRATVIVDPPRAGLHPKVIRAFQDAKIDRILYVSCNPATLARDVMLLREHYRPRFVQPFDLFPQTLHVETFIELQHT